MLPFLWSGAQEKGRGEGIDPMKMAAYRDLGGEETIVLFAVCFAWPAVGAINSAAGTGRLCCGALPSFGGGQV